MTEDTFEDKRIPESIDFNLDQVSDENSIYPHMLPNQEKFNNEMNKLGVTPNDNIVIYDSQQMYLAPRVSWMLRTFGAKKVSVLDGTFSKWLAENKPTSTAMKP